jgi:two-component system cell cycle sensor histidine kinase/response regulator CckA
MAHVVVKNKNSISIVVIDDEPDVLRIFESALTETGYDAKGFSSPEEALKFIRANRQSCSVVVSDVRIPGMNGFVLAREVRRTAPDIKIVLVSGFEINMPEYHRFSYNSSL